MDGTIYLGEQVFPAAVEYITRLSGNGKKVVFFTNNASRNRNSYIKKLERMGFPLGEKAVYTSADVLVQYLLLHRQDKTVFLLGTPELAHMFRESGVRLAEISDVPDIVVSSFDITLTYEKAEAACRFIRNGAEWLSTHPDINCPVENGYIPDCGAINAMISASSGKPPPPSFGKPSGMVIEMLEEIYGMKRMDMVIYGDRLYTDIALGRNNGVTAVLMLTGESSEKDVSSLEEHQKPDIILNNFTEIYK